MLLNQVFSLVELFLEVYYLLTCYSFDFYINFSVLVDSKFIPDMNEEFVCAMLFEHARAFQMQKSSQSMDCFSLAIQVNSIVLRLFFTVNIFFPTNVNDFRKF